MLSSNEIVAVSSQVFVKTRFVAVLSLSEISKLLVSIILAQIS
jgi:hypothetical protein